jgi:DNA-binding YbaB/EbfC family protein
MSAIVSRAQKMQEDIKVIQDQIAQEEFSESGADGRVEVKMTGARQLTSVKVSPEMLPDDDTREELEDLILSAVNKVIATIDAESESRLDKATDGISFPGMI